MKNLFGTLMSATTLSAKFTMDRKEFIELLNDWTNDFGIYVMFSNGNTWILNLVMESSGWNFNNLILTTNLYDNGNTIAFQLDFKNDYQANQYKTLGDKRETEYTDTLMFEAFVKSLEQAY